jgi:hypothetical protein
MAGMPLSKTQTVLKISEERLRLAALSATQDGIWRVSKLAICGWTLKILEQLLKTNAVNTD